MIEVTGLAKTFGAGKRPAVEAVRGVDFSVRAGEIVGFLGPNGAGKTTTLRMLTTLLAPSGGTATVAGADLIAEPRTVRERIGYVAQVGGTDPACLVGEELVTQARLYRVPPAEARERAAKLCGRLELSGLEGRAVRTLSGGQKRRLDIALGLVHEPRLVFLDEPTTGLDPQSRSNMWDHIRGMRDELDTTVFLTTHYLEEADALCDRILVIDGGGIVAEGTPEELKQRIAGDVVTVSVDGDPAAAKAVLAGLDGVRETVVAEPSVVRLTVTSGDQMLFTVMRALDSAGIRAASIQLARPTLDDVFLTLTGRSLREDRPAGDRGAGDRVAGDRADDLPAVPAPSRAAESPDSRSAR